MILEKEIEKNNITAGNYYYIINGHFTYSWSVGYLIYVSNKTYNGFYSQLDLLVLFGNTWQFLSVDLQSINSVFVCLWSYIESQLMAYPIPSKLKNYLINTKNHFNSFYDSFEL